MNRLWLSGVCVFFLFSGHTFAADDKTDAILKLFVEEFVSITPGKDKFPASFKMGSDTTAEEKPIHEVTLKDSFSMAKYEVTQELYEAIMGKNPSKWKGPRNSAEMMTYKDSLDFCKKVTTELRKRKLIKENEEIRLPTEAEWEYCCRADTKTPYSFGEEKDIKEYAWYKGNSKDEDPPVGKKKPNAWGLYDMHGYLWEFCQDSWTPDYKDAPKDGSAVTAKDAKEIVARSGSWNDPADRLRSSARVKFGVDDKSDTLGFRCVLSKSR